MISKTSEVGLEVKTQSGFVRITVKGQRKIPVSSILELETFFFWCQKFRLDLLSSEHVSENFLEVGNILKIDLERYGDFRRLPATSYLLKKFNNNKRNNEKPTSSIFELEPSFWCQKLRLDLLISDLVTEKI
jgi:hypothetical protein